MKPEQERVRHLLTDTVTLLCKNGLQYQKELRVQGLLGITLDDSDVFVVHINETFGDLIGGAISMHFGGDDSEQLALDVEPQPGSKLNTHTMSRKLKQRHRSGDQSSPDVGRPAAVKSLKRSSSSSSSFQNHSTDTSAVVKESNNDRVPSTNSEHFDVNVIVKTEKDLDDVMIIGDKSVVQSCAVAGGSADISQHADTMYSGLGETSTNNYYQQFDKVLDMMSDMPGDPVGSEPSAKRHLTQDHYSTTAMSHDDIVSGGGPFVTGLMHNDSSTLGNITTDSVWDSSQVSFTDSGTADAAAPGCSTWSTTASMGRPAMGQVAADQSAESVGREEPVLLTDAEFEQLGVLAIGNRVTVRARCNAATRGGNSSNDPSVSAVIQRRNQFQSKRKRRAWQGTKMGKKVKQTRRINLGWKHKSSPQALHSLVSASKGGGLHTRDVQREATLEFLMDYAKAVFFPNGINTRSGRNAADCQFHLATFGGEPLESATDGDEFSLESYVASSGYPVRIYLHTCNSTDQNEDVLPHIAPPQRISRPPFLQPQGANVVLATEPAVEEVKMETQEVTMETQEVTVETQDVIVALEQPIANVPVETDLVRTMVDERWCTYDGRHPGRARIGASESGF